MMNDNASWSEATKGKKKMKRQKIVDNTMDAKLNDYLNKYITLTTW